MPHGHCYLWQPALVYLHVLSDGLIALAYASISISLFVLWRRIKLPFNGMLVGFGLFIFLCGVTHAMEIWTLWQADYWASGFLKAATATASIATAIVTVYIAPKILAFVNEARLSEKRRVDLDAARESSEMKDRFLANVTHELRAPLNVVIGYSQMLALEPNNRELMTEAISAIERNAETQNKLIGDLLDVSRISAGKLKLHVEKVNLAEIIEECATSVSFAARAKDIKVVLELEPRAEMIGDRMRLSQVVSNLLTNAVKYTGKGGAVKVRLSRRPVSTFELNVSDNGIGIAPDFLPKLFDRFTQESGPRDRVAGGLGLGLSIAANLVELHGGTIEAKSEGKGKGSSFIVRLPIKPLEELQPQEAQAGSASSEESPSVDTRLDGMRILLLDDDLDGRRMLLTALTLSGAKVTAFAKGREALAELERNADYSVIVSDIDMPEMNGFQFIRAVRALNGKAGKIPALAFTSYLQEHERSLAFHAGFQKFLQKPVAVGLLAKTLTELAKSGAERA